MEIAPDGSPVQLYLRLPERAADARLIDELLPPGGTVLDLGCGTGRLAEPLVALGHPTTAVDIEPAMVANLRLATGVVADIAGLDLGTRFDAVLLMSHLVDGADIDQVDAFLATIRRHLSETGFAVVERYPPGWVPLFAETTQEIDGIRYTLFDVVHDDDTVTVTMRYEFDGQAADQRISFIDMRDDRLASIAATAGLRFTGALNDNGALVRLDPIRAPHLTPILDPDPRTAGG